MQTKEKERFRFTLYVSSKIISLRSRAEEVSQSNPEQTVKILVSKSTGRNKGGTFSREYLPIQQMHRPERSLSPVGNSQTRLRKNTYGKTVTGKAKKTKRFPGGATR